MIIIVILFASLFLFGCSPSVGDAEKYGYTVGISPDYTSIIVPCNIAPMNFKITETADDYYTKICGDNGFEIDIRGREVIIPARKWKRLLADNAGGNISIDIYLKTDGKWKQYERIVNTVSGDKIDPYLVYRKIGPSYTSWSEMGIYERSLESFDVRTINKTTRVNGDCMNCHSFQAGDGNHFMLHLRPNQKNKNSHPGTVIIDGDIAYKIDTKTNNSYSSGAYPAWHPKEKIIAFSTNNTTQSFHSADAQKVEVIDSRSDLIMYDIETHKRSNIIAVDSLLETFPAWSADGKYLYYCVAKLPVNPDFNDPFYNHNVSMLYKDIKYNIMRMSFDSGKKSFGEPELVLDAVSMGKSASHPRMSPDGKYLMLTLSDFGQFSIWHVSSDLCLYDLAKGELIDMTETNSNNVDSYHTWSSNSRWFTFASRRMDGSYSHPYFAYSDGQGHTSKPFILPQRSPDFYEDYYYSYNVPELIKTPVNVSATEMMWYANKEANKID